MIVDTIRQIIEKNGGRHPLYVRTLMKEVLQDYMLHFVYNHKIYKELIFTGGTCLRKLYGLPRLSEDIDFDFIQPVSIGHIAEDIKRYFSETHQYKFIETKIAGNQRTVFVKFPFLLRDTKLIKNRSDTTQLFVRVDVAPAAIGNYKTEVRPIMTREFTFFVNAYDLSTLFTNKIIAFLTRDFYKGKTQVIAFKGRDVFDLVWFFEMMRTRKDVVLQWERLYQALKATKKKTIVELLVSKIKLLDLADVRRDLDPFIESPQAVAVFSEHARDVLLTGIRSFFGAS